MYATTKVYSVRRHVGRVVSTRLSPFVLSGNVVYEEKVVCLLSWRHARVEFAAMILSVPPPSGCLISYPYPFSELRLFTTGLIPTEPYYRTFVPKESVGSPRKFDGKKSKDQIF